MKQLNILERLQRIHPLVEAVTKDHSWLLHQTTPRRLTNIMLAAWSYAAKATHVRCSPTILKVDISPLCNLRCTNCVHAVPNGRPQLERQRFHGGQRMTVEQFSQIVDSCRGSTSALSLYHLGDPLVHPDLPEMCRIASEACLNTHINTNLSFNLSDERIRALLCSGLTHLTVCVDGLTQETYEKTRVGGKVDLVLSNLERIQRLRSQLKLCWPRVEIQFLRFQHNQEEEPLVRKKSKALGVEQFTFRHGSLKNYADYDIGAYTVLGPRPMRRLPFCHWPYIGATIRYNGDLIPCCHYRIPELYAEDGQYRPLGNVFRTPLQAIWNSPQYKLIRRMITNPIACGAEGQDSFCYGCHMIFNTTLQRD